MRTIKTYFKGAPFYNAFLRPYPQIVFFIEHSGSSPHGTLTNLKLVCEGHLQMQNARHNESREERHPTNRFNDSE
jgi:hypothetical protein